MLLPVVSCLLVFLPARAGDFKWEPITPTDWAVVGDSQSTAGAIMLFEKVFADDQRLIDERCYRIIYRRIRITNNEGRSWGDVDIPYLNKAQKIEKILGRTVLPDGSEILLDKNKVIEKEVVKAKGLKIKQKSFSLPGVSDDCIIEYYYKIRLRYPVGTWTFQKEIPLKTGELTWEFYRGRGLIGRGYRRTAEFLTPNFTAINYTGKVISETRPTIKDPKMVYFRVDTVAPFKDEPFSLPDIALKGQIRYYYGSPGTPATYWGDISLSIREGLAEFTRRNKRVKEVITPFLGLADNEAKITAAYQWLQQNITNVDYNDNVKRPKDNNNADDVLKRRYGTSLDINRVFYDMLREMNIDAHFAYTVDRDDDFFVYSAKYWQFSRSMVAVSDEKGEYHFYSPAVAFLPAGETPWYNEGTSALLAESLDKQFYRIPFSAATFSQFKRFRWLALDAQNILSGKMIEQSSGHFARDLRLDLEDRNEADGVSFLQETFNKRFAEAQMDSIEIRDIDNIDKPLSIQCEIDMPATPQKAGSRMLLNCSELLGVDDNPFLAEDRQHLIMFKHAQIETEVLEVGLPEGWIVEALPADTAVQNAIGASSLLFRKLRNGTAFSIQWQFRLDHPMIKQIGYTQVKDLWEAGLAAQKMTVVMQRVE